MASHTCNKEKEIDKLFIISEKTQIDQATMSQEIKDIKEKLNSVDNKLDQLPAHLKGLFVSNVEFEREKQKNDISRKIVFGGVALILVGALTAMLTLVFIK